MTLQTIVPVMPEVGHCTLPESLLGTWRVFPENGVGTGERIIITETELDTSEDGLCKDSLGWDCRKYLSLSFDLEF